MENELIPWSYEWHKGKWRILVTNRPCGEWLRGKIEDYTTGIWKFIAEGIEDEETAALIASLPDIVAERDALKKRVEELGREVNLAKYGESDFAWNMHKIAMYDLQDENEMLRAKIKELTNEN